jgi:hypothetical protein
VVNKSKCAIGVTSVVYLAHIISAQGVAMDAENVKAVQAWQQTCTVHEVCGFLDLTGYYPKFIRSYAERDHGTAHTTPEVGGILLDSGNNNSIQILEDGPDCSTGSPIARLHEDLHRVRDEALRSQLEKITKRKD